jgi:hypothetical protein
MGRGRPPVGIWVRGSARHQSGTGRLPPLGRLARGDVTVFEVWAPSSRDGDSCIPTQQCGWLQKLWQISQPRPRVGHTGARRSVANMACYRVPTNPTRACSGAMRGCRPASLHRACMQTCRMQCRCMLSLLPAAAASHHRRSGHAYRPAHREDHHHPLACTRTWRLHIARARAPVAFNPAGLQPAGRMAGALVWHVRHFSPK